MSELSEKISLLIKQGYKQLSRKYRLLGRLPAGMTGLEALRVVDFPAYKEVMERANDQAADHFLRGPYDLARKNQLELTREEFDEYLRQTGRCPEVAPR